MVFAPHFYLLSVQSYKGLKLRAFKEWLFRKTNWRQILVVRLTISQTSLCSYFVSWKIYLLTSKKIAFMSSTEMIIQFCIFLRLRHEKKVFCEINFCDVGILWKKCEFFSLFSRSQCFNRFFSTKSKKKIRCIW